MIARREQRAEVCTCDGARARLGPGAAQSVEDEGAMALARFSLPLKQWRRGHPKGDD